MTIFIRAISPQSYDILKYLMYVFRKNVMYECLDYFVST